VGLFQLSETALLDVARFDPSFVPDPDLRTNAAYAARAAWGYLTLNLRPGRAAGDLALALAMQRTGPQPAEAELYRWWGEAIIARAREWESEWLGR
jgi:hypothetical protein